ncbi:MAG: hypothetical protein FWD17_02905 [Polyangiaceae bacterium]|nr:hypothetical protein [Polyangiaceae bacterium]
MTASLRADLPSGMAARHLSESNEHYTPAEIVESARRVLGRIDLDPASSEVANAVVQAAQFFTYEDNGYRHCWSGTVFLNPPGGRSDNQERPVPPGCGNPGHKNAGRCGLPAPHTHSGVESNAAKWWTKLASEWQAGRVSAATFIMFSLEQLQTLQLGTPPGPLDFPRCYPRRRVAYRTPGGGIGKSPTHASAIFLVSSEREAIERFHREFEGYGRVEVPVPFERAIEVGKLASRGRPKKGEGKGGNYHLSPKEKNTAAHVRARLERDAPSLPAAAQALERLKAGEISAHKAAVLAGYRKASDPAKLAAPAIQASE